MGPVIVEVVSRWGQVRSRHRLAQFPATLGRALTCDVILDEADVSARHAQVVQREDGALVLEDLGSTNGVRVRGKRVAQLELGARTDVRLGSAHLRLLSVEAPVEKTVTFRLSRLEHPGVVALSLGVLLAVMWLNESGLKATRTRGVDTLEALVGMTVVCAAWAFGWSLASRVAQGHFRFLGHFTATLLAMSAFALTGDLVLPGLAFVLRAGPAARSVIEGGGVALVLGWLLLQHLVRVSTWSTQRVLVMVGALLSVGAVLVGVHEASEASRYSSAVPGMGKMFPPAFLVGPASRAEVLRDDVQELAGAVDTER